jgi:hypothetical protein
MLQEQIDSITEIGLWQAGIRDSQNHPLLRGFHHTLSYGQDR